MSNEPNKIETSSNLQDKDSISALPLRSKSSIREPGPALVRRTEGIFWHQTMTIMKRDLKIILSSARFLFVFVITTSLIPAAFMLANTFVGRTGAYYSVVILNGSLSRVIITSQVEERAKKFRSTFRLMGKFHLPPRRINIFRFERQCVFYRSIPGKYWNDWDMFNLLYPWKCCIQFWILLVYPVLPLDLLNSVLQYGYDEYEHELVLPHQESKDRCRRLRPLHFRHRLHVRSPIQSHILTP